MVARVAASSAGSLFPRGGNVWVHSIFASAVNLCRAEDPYPVALLRRAEFRHPRAAVVSAQPGADFGTWGLSPGDRAVFRDGILKFEKPEAPEVDLRGAEGFDETLTAAAVGAQTVQDAKDLLAERQRSAGTALVIGATASVLSRRVDEALSLLPRRFDEGARLLVGLGEGLTPSGDDVLVGWLAALKVRGREVPRLGSLKTATNAISASFLDAAERGLFASALLGFVKALSRRETLAPALDSLAAIGHSSGLDAALGVLSGLERLTPQENP